MKWKEKREDERMRMEKKRQKKQKASEGALSDGGNIV